MSNSDNEDRLSALKPSQLANGRHRRFSTWDVEAPREGHVHWQQQEPESWKIAADDEKPLFIEMLELTQDLRGKLEWREAARWIKYEEIVEKESNRWSKPFVPSLHLNDLEILKSLLNENILELNLDANNLNDIFIKIVQDLNLNENVCEILNRRFVHLYERTKEHSTLEYMLPNYGIKREVERSRKKSAAAKQPTLEEIKAIGNKSTLSPRGNASFMKKIPTGAEACNILIGEYKGIAKAVSAFVRLKEPIVLGNITEVPVPSRFMLVILAPKGELQTYSNVGQAFGALMSDPHFKAISYKANNRQALLNGLDSFMKASTVLPPAGWDTNIRIEPVAVSKEHLEFQEEEMQPAEGLTRTGKLFGGLINDIKRKAKWYISDYRDAISVQVLATWLFLYFACLTPMITFGGILGEATNKQMGTMEVMVAGCICGCTFALFAGQPLLILGSTGPMLIFEKIVIQVCHSMEFNYLEFRVWIGIWVAIILVILVATDASAFVQYITRFTEENFATLVACIFIFEAFKNLIHIKNIDVHATVPSIAGTNETNLSTTEMPITEIPGPTSDKTEEPSLWSPNDRGTIFLLSILLFIGTFFISYTLKSLRNSSFFPTIVRYLISDFAVVIAIIIMAAIDYSLDINTPKLHVPTEFAPTTKDRGWFIQPFNQNELWTIAAAIVPALLATILIFMDQQITAVIINRKDHKLKKGAGYHLDLLILAFLILTCSLLGLPWLIAATVESLTNLNSLKQESESNAPGEKPIFLGVREQRVSNLLIFITIGLSVTFTSILKVVPMPVLYGVFLFMGFSALTKMDLFNRILLVFMPNKYQPDLQYLRHVPTVKVHLFTGIQVLSLIVLWVIKSIPATAIAFPLMLLVMMLLRKLLESVFTLKELAALDDLLPGTKIENDNHQSNNVNFNNTNHKTHL